MRLNLIRIDRTPFEKTIEYVGVAAWIGAFPLAYLVVFRERIPYWVLASAVAVLAGIVGYLALALREVTGAVVHLLDKNERMERGVDHETWEYMKQHPTLTPKEAKRAMEERRQS